LWKTAISGIRGVGMLGPPSPMRATIRNEQQFIGFYDIKVASGHPSDYRPRSRPQYKQLKRAYRSREGIMYRFATPLIGGITVTVLVSGIGFMPAPAQAAKLSNAERIALEKACMQSRGEGHEVSWHWRKRQKYVQNCIIRSASKQGIDILEVRSRA